MANPVKSNSRMPPRTKANINALVQQVESWDSPHKQEALQFLSKNSPEKVFEMLHSMRRWYSGQTMARAIANHRGSLQEVMHLDPKDALGVYRGFKVDKNSPLANIQVGQKLDLEVTRNHGFSSWSTSQEAVNRFSGGGKGKVGIVVKLDDHQGITPVLAPPTHTSPWFNEMYAHVIGKSFRPKEGEYLIQAPKVSVEVIRVKR